MVHLEDSEGVQHWAPGFIISADGYVVTNNHVIENADQIEIEFFDGRLMEATVVRN